MSQLLFETNPHAGAWNMALDEALLESAVNAGRVWLRIYRWEAATVSLGYFQSAEDESLHNRFAGLPQVRRLSGGGAILHHHEWTYSCHFPATHPFAREPLQLYTRVHEALRSMLADWAIGCRFRGQSHQAAAEPFLCFGRGDSHDLVMEEVPPALGIHKIVGSAQRRRKGAVAQHGSILLRRSAFAAEFPGLFDLATVPVTEIEFGETLSLQLALALEISATPVVLPQEIQAVARVLEHERYQTLNWPAATLSKT